jgi:photosystem II stability/assembly factor-like uncharacterized protein
VRVLTCLLVLTVAASATASEQLAYEADQYGNLPFCVVPDAPGDGNGGGLVGIWDWEFLGPCGGHARCVTASPFDCNIVLAGMEGRMYRSVDGGLSWSVVGDLSTTVYDIEFAPDGAIYIGTESSIWESTDDAVSWTKQDLDITFDPAVHEVVVDPNDCSSIWVGISDRMYGRHITVMHSTDGGSTWVDKSPPTSEDIACYGMALDPDESSNLYVCLGWTGRGQVWVSTDSGTSWVKRSSGLPDSPLLDIVHDGSRLLVAGGQRFGSQDVGLYASADSGRSWSPLHDATWPLLVIHDIEIDPNNADVIFVASAGFGAYRSLDGGDTWEFGVGGTGLLSVNSVRFAAGSSSEIYLGASCLGAFKSIDGGDTFVHWSDGIRMFDVRHVDVNPNDSHELALAFAGLNDGGLLSSTDGGETWLVEQTPPTRYRAVRFGPYGALYAVSNGPASIAPEGLYRRDADGLWTCLGPDQGVWYETDICGIGFSRTDPNLIVAGGNDWGMAGDEATIWRSVNAGDTWTKVYEGPTTYQYVTDIEIIEEISDSTMLASVSGKYSVDGTVLRSVDGGTSWVESTTGLPADILATDLCVWPPDTFTFYLSSSAHSDGVGGLYISTDGGQTWSSTGYLGPRVLRIVCDPTDYEILYIVQSGDHIAMRSSDRGTTFAPFDSGLESAGSGRNIRYAEAAKPHLVIATSSGIYRRAAEHADFVRRCLGDMSLRWEWGDPPSYGGEEFTVAVHDGAGIPIPYVLPPRNMVSFITDVQGQVWDMPAPERVEIYYYGLIVSYDPETCDTVSTIRLPDSWRDNHALAHHDMTPGQGGGRSFWYTRLTVDSLYHIDASGDPIGTYPAFYDSITGLALDANNSHLWGIIRSSPDMFVEYDLSSGIPQVIQGPLPVPWSSPVNQSAAGLEYDDEKHLLIAIDRICAGMETFCDLDPEYSPGLEGDDPGVAPASAHALFETPSPWGIARLDFMETVFVAGNPGGGPFPMDEYRLMLPLAGIARREVPSIPRPSLLARAYPNPFRATADIRYVLPADCHANLSIYNAQGQKVATLVDAMQAAGDKSIKWNGHSYASGIYFYRLKAGDLAETGKMVLLK